jgi:hypothetical protein
MKSTAPAFIAATAFHDSAVSGQHDHRKRIACISKAAEQFDTVHARHAQIDDDAGGRGTAIGGEELRAAGKSHGAKAGRAQQLGHALA